MIIGIVGLGLVGGSLALDLLARDRPVVGYDTSGQARELATASGVPLVDTVDEVAEAAEVVVVAVPPAEVAEVVRQVAVAAPDVVVTDVASVCSPAALGLDPVPANWIGGHPMAGTERTGFAAARRGMLAGATWLLTPGDEVAAPHLRAVLDLVLSVDAVPVVLDAAEHDRLVAAVSHVTHLLSYGLHDVAGTLGRQVVDLVAGPSFRDTTRVAASDPAFWADLVARNRDAVREVLAQVQDWLTAAVEEDPEVLADRLTAARRRPLPAPGGAADVLLDGSSGAVVELRRLGRDGYAVVGVEADGAGTRVQLARR